MFGASQLILLEPLPVPPSLHPHGAISFHLATLPLPDLVQYPARGVARYSDGLLWRVARTSVQVRNVTGHARSCRVVIMLLHGRLLSLSSIRLMNAAVRTVPGNTMAWG